MSLKHKLKTGAFAVLVEMEPPKGADVSAMVANAQKVKGIVDAFVVPEMRNAVMRMSSGQRHDPAVKRHGGGHAGQLQGPQPLGLAGGSSGGKRLRDSQCHGGQWRGPQFWRSPQGKSRV